MDELTGFQRDLLYVIAGTDEPSGREIMADIDDYVEEVTHGRLYPNLDALVECGLVEKGERDRRTNYYALTDRGERALEERREWTERYVEV
ncbi:MULTISPECIES: PadR family transcriptional regulator [Saliphagus]|uniref:PadR family transcriptional regulator n=1 Tax=Saliphagus infecundisoli TaxID=1849069 RepID=A0ABD5QD47_9EURY|nr:MULTISPECIES: helix-turn-helix transcriptional regulator [Saliphagus]